MKRELKIRAWHLSKKIMAEVRDFNWTGEVHVSYKQGPEKSGYFFGGNTVGDDWLKDEHILMKFTGLKDKNGKDIYEGDILENDNGVKYVVVWAEQLAAFYLSIPNTQRGKEIISCAASKVANEPMLLFKEAVIGNVYDNPELLEP